MMGGACALFHVKLLVESGADSTIKDHEEKSPADLYHALKDHRELTRAAYDYLMKIERR